MGISAEFSDDLAIRLGLTKLPEYFPVFLLSFLAFTAIHLLLAPFLSLWLVPELYGNMSKRARNNWCIHVVSQVHALVVVPFSIWCLFYSTELQRDKAFAWDHQSGVLQAIACGYFLWDTLDAVVNYVNIGFVIHGLTCFAIYLLSFKPFLAYFASRCLIWETSTIYLNNNWFMEKTGRSGTAFHKSNAIMLLVTFFSIRLVYGAWTSYEFFGTLISVRDRLPTSFVVVYGTGNIMLQALNWMWFVKMVSTAKQRLSGKRFDQKLTETRLKAVEETPLKSTTTFP